MYLLNVLTDEESQLERQVHDLRSLLQAKGTVSIGRDPATADIAMDSKDLPAMISRNHAEIRWDGDKFCLQDRKSVNGTWLNGVRMKPLVWQRLSDGDTVSFGGTVHVQRKARSVRNPFVYVVGIDAASHMMSYTSASVVTCDRQDENSASRGNSIVQEPVRIASVSDAGDLAGTVLVKAGEAQTLAMARNSTSPNGAQQQRVRPESEFECPICREFMCYPVTMVPCGHSYCSECICKAFMLQPRDRRVCPLCRSKPTHAPMRVQLLAHSLSRAIAALPEKEQQRYNERVSIADAVQEEVQEKMKEMFGKKSASTVPARTVRLSDARRASETGLMRRREEYRGGGYSPGGPVGATGQSGELNGQQFPGAPGGVSQAGDRVRLGALAAVSVSYQPQNLFYNFHESSLVRHVGLRPHMPGREHQTGQL